MIVIRTGREESPYEENHERHCSTVARCTRVSHSDRTCFRHHTL
ncbi:hypothetical protein RchiOBHm_Chr2g0133901 [Rosa chinensis]|uniref:Uncharacterized protein n=1 Tax=Rosa chinensis TaxID=74649 RepID=A0A2P6RVP6_ROSCH|nr:hypothetical protein RchiOBHm_Chr2g0133901 [Rosa chinensis]